MFPKSFYKTNSNKPTYDTFNHYDEHDDAEHDNDIINDDEFINVFVDEVSRTCDYEDIKLCCNKYYYPALDELNKNVEEITEIGFLFICEYSINTDGITPFLQFQLSKTLNKELSFICLPYTNKECKSLTSLTNFKGYLKEKSNVYMFFEMDDKTASNKKRVSVLSEEIINKEHVFGFKISEYVYDFFVSKHNIFLFLTDERGKLYELPCSAYYGTEKDDAEFTASFGVSPSKRDALVGAYYYFTNYENALKNSKQHPSKQAVHKYSKQISDDNGVYSERGRVLRFALFLGNARVVMNHPNDPHDESALKKQLLEEAQSTSSGEYNKLKQTMRISDHDGKWTKEYDSVFINNYLKLDDGTELNEGPYWVVKEYNQQLFLNLE